MASTPPDYGPAQLQQSQKSLDQAKRQEINTRYAEQKSSQTSKANAAAQREAQFKAYSNMNPLGLIDYQSDYMSGDASVVTKKQQQISSGSAGTTSILGGDTGYTSTLGGI